MPVFNGGDFLCEAIESVLKQTFRDFEFLIINDGSTDASLSVIQKYQSLDGRIKVISRPNKGLVASLNEGIDVAVGKYIARMDADDICLPTRFEEQVNLLENNLSVGVCGSWVEVFGENMRCSVMRQPFSMAEMLPNLLFSVCFAHPSVMIRVDALNLVKIPYDPNYISVEDYELWTRLRYKTKFANIQKVLLRYRYIETSVSRLADSEGGDNRFKRVKSVFSKELDALGVVNNIDEDFLHFIVASNERLGANRIDIRELANYFEKLHDANKSMNLYSLRYLFRVLCRKYLVATFYQFKLQPLSIISSIRSRLFYVGVYNFVLEVSCQVISKKL